MSSDPLGVLIISLRHTFRDTSIESYTKKIEPSSKSAAYIGSTFSWELVLRLRSKSLLQPLTSFIATIFWPRLRLCAKTAGPAWSISIIGLYWDHGFWISDGTGIVYKSF